jgi:hypothetical protein
VQMLPGELSVGLVKPGSISQLSNGGGATSGFNSTRAAANGYLG